MDLFILVLVNILGLIIGSFLNVVIFRLESEEGLGGRSHCGKCTHMLSWYELVPLFSFIFLRARCRKCKSSISWQYPLVELSTALLFTGVYLVEGVSLTGLLMLVLFSFLVAIFWYDLRHLIIPNVLVYPFNALAFLLLFIGGDNILSLPFLLEVSAGPLVALPLYLLWLVSGGRWIGFADSKLALGTGWLLGVVSGFSAVMLAFWVGAVFSLSLLLIQKLLLVSPHFSLTMKSEVPFAPFLIVGLLLVYFFNINAFMLFVW
mgnify:CR=1 FL=1